MPDKAINLDRLGNYDVKIKELASLWNKSTSYALNKIVQFQGTYLKCITAGTSGSSTLDLTTIVGNQLTDGTCVWEVVDPFTSSGGATISDWVTSTNIEEDGMSIAQINALTPEILSQLDVSNGIAFKQCFIATSESASAELSEISAVVDIDGSWSQSVHGTDYSVVYPNKTIMSVRLLTNGDYIINYPISSSS